MSAQLVATRYELGERIGSGGLAVVYLARDVRLDRPVAVKVLREQYAADPEFLPRFQREARIAAGLNHPNVVAVYDFGAFGDTFFIAMEYVDGGSLKDEIRAHGPLGPREAIRIAREVLAALGAAHARGLVHRDVKPQNVLLTRQRVAKLTDFGIAHAPATTQLTQVGMSIGTAAYVAPEQAQGLPAGPPADVYGVGLLLYEMLTGAPPFGGDSAPAIVYRQVNEPPPPPSARAAGVSPALDAIVMRALEKNPARRYPTAEAMRAALDQPDLADAWANSATGTTARVAPAVVSVRRPAAVRRPSRPAWLLPLVLVGVALVVAAFLALRGRSAGTPAPTQTIPTASAAPSATTAGRPESAAATVPTAVPTTTAPTAIPTQAAQTAPAPAERPAPTATAAPTERPAPTAPPPTERPAPTATPRPQPTTTPPRPTAAATATSPPAAPAAGPSGAVTIEDTAFAGGFRNPGPSIYRQRTATWVYAANTPYSTMTATFDLPAAPGGRERLTIVGLSSEHSHPQMAVAVNGTEIYRGASPFDTDSLSQDFENAPAPWTPASWELPAGLLHAGANTLTVENLEPDGAVGLPPFVMVDQARIEPG